MKNYPPNVIFPIFSQRHKSGAGPKTSTTLGLQGLVTWGQAPDSVFEKKHQAASHAAPAPPPPPPPPPTASTSTPQEPERDSRPIYIQEEESFSKPHSLVEQDLLKAYQRMQELQHQAKGQKGSGKKEAQLRHLQVRVSELEANSRSQGGRSLQVLLLGENGTSAKDYFGRRGAACVAIQARFRGLTVRREFGPVLAERGRARREA